MGLYTGGLYSGGLIVGGLRYTNKFFFKNYKVGGKIFVIYKKNVICI